MPGAPLFTTFDEAWSHFEQGGALVPIEAQREHFLRGRAQFLSLQVPVAGMEVAADIADIQDRLVDIDSMSPIPAELLHISVRGVGFQVIAKSLPNDVLRQEVGSISERAAKAMHGRKPLEVTVGPVNVFPDALILEVNPVEPMREILRRTNQALEGADAFPYSADNYLPHVTIGTFLDAPAAASALRDRLPALRHRAPASTTIRGIDFVRWWFTGHDLTAWPELETIRSYRLR